MLLASVAFACLLHSGPLSFGQEKPEASGAETKTTLHVGDKAPKLEVDHWLGGGLVESFSKDNFYVIEFWATWCGPCIQSMPHLSELADRYAKQGLIVAAVTNIDESNTKEAIEEFIKGPGEKYSFRYAICESNTTYRNYMEAAGQNGIPCSFVIDREGKVAYIGHPHDLDYVLERVVAGKWRGKQDADELREMNESIAKLGTLASSDPDKALQIIDHIRRVNPQEQEHRFCLRTGNGTLPKQVVRQSERSHRIVNQWLEQICGMGIDCDAEWFARLKRHESRRQASRLCNGQDQRSRERIERRLAISPAGGNCISAFWR